MTLVLIGMVRLFTGNPVEAITYAGEARDVFASISDRAGQIMALAPLARALAASGAVGDAFALVTPTDVHDGMTYAGPDTFAGLLPAALALQVGNPDAAAAAIGELPAPNRGGKFVGHGEELVVRGLVMLQRGQAEDAASWFRSADQTAHSDGERAHARSWLAVALCALGDPAGALDTAASLPSLSAGTYLDRGVGALAEGFAFLQLHQRPEGERAFAGALSAVDSTGDRLSQAIFRLAYGHALGGLGDDGAAEVLADARTRLDAMGAPAVGWDTAYSLAASASATAAR
jgi:hypothetical protein